MNNASYYSPLQNIISQKKDIERPQINSVHCNNSNLSILSEKITKSILLKDLNKERKVIKSNRSKENSPMNEILSKAYIFSNTQTKLKEKSDFCEKNREPFKKDEINLDKKHLNMCDLEILEDNWKLMKLEQNKRISNLKNDFGGENTKKDFAGENINRLKILKHLVPRSRINLQIQEENNIISKSLNENDFLKMVAKESPENHQQVRNNTHREINSREIENLLPTNLIENEKKMDDPSKKELKNQLYMKSIFEKYSNIYQKKVPEATKIGKIVNYDKSFNSFNGFETPKISKLANLSLQKENYNYKEDLYEKQPQNSSLILKKPARKSSVEVDGKDKLKKLFSSRNKPNEDFNEKKSEKFKEKEPLHENKNLENLKIFNEAHFKQNKEAAKTKEASSYSSIHKHKRQLSNTLIKIKKNFN